MLFCLSQFLIIHFIFCFVILFLKLLLLYDESSSAHIIIIIITLFQEDSIFATNVSLTYGHLIFSCNKYSSLRQSFFTETQKICFSLTQDSSSG